MDAGSDGGAHLHHARSERYRAATSAGYARAVTDLIKGGNAPISADRIDIAVSGASPGTVDLLVFQVDASGKVRSDADMVFYNQQASPEGAVRLTGPDRLEAVLSGVPADIATLVVSVALDDSVPGSLAAVQGLGVTVADGGERHSAAADGLSGERAAILAEVYRRGDGWKIRNVSAGWDAGLAALAREYGVTIDEGPGEPAAPAAAASVAPPAVQTPPAPPVPPQAPQYQAPPAPQHQAPPAPPQAPQYQAPPAPEYQAPQAPTYQAPPAPAYGAPPAQPAAAPPAPAYGAPPAPGAQPPMQSPPQAAPAGPRSVPGEQALSLEKRQALDLRKQQVHRVLLTKNATGVRARVLLVLDKTGSMSREYSQGVVQRVVERMVPVATQLDDDGTLECYLYAKEFLKLPDLRVEHLEPWITEFVHLRGVHGGLDYDRIGAVNHEIPIMQELVSQLRAGDPVPTLILFFTDGGFSNRKPIIKLITEAAHLPAFWQFVGIGRSGSFGVLEKLDDMGGRVVDNVDFFPVSDIDRMSDDELYKLLLTEFPDWLAAARAQRIVG